MLKPVLAAHRPLTPALCLVLLFSVCLIGSARHVDAAADDQLNNRVKYDSEYRAMIGFRSDHAYVSQVDQQHAAAAAVVGIPATEEEVIELKRRTHLGSVIPSIELQFANDPTFAGAWLDQKAGGVLKIGFVTTPSNTKTAAINRLTGPTRKYTPIRLVSSLRTLGSIADKLDFGDYGVQISSIDRSNNAVRVSILRGEPKSKDAAIKRAAGGVSVIIDRIDAAPVPMVIAGRFDKTGLLISGQLIENANTGGRATMGYANVRNSSGQIYAITAGHVASTGESVRHGIGGPVFGVAHNSSKNVTAPYIRCDCVPIGPLTSAFKSRQYLTGPNAVVAFYQSGSPYEGQTLCHDGVSTWTETRFNVCGVVQDPTNGYYGNLAYAIRMNIRAASGDSGAALFDGDGGHTLYGFLSGGRSPDILFSNVKYLSERGVTAVYN